MFLLAPWVLCLPAARAADVTVAFVGDQGHRENAEHLMERVRDGGVDLLVLGGDLGYGDDAEPWIEMMERALGEDFPVISVVGNHELYNWPQYRAWLAARIERVPELVCDGDVGVKAHCHFRGLSIVQIAPGVHEVPGVDPDDDYAGYIRDEFAEDPSAWRVCSFHKNQTAMQIGNKDDATGWGVYEACREAGALVATAHEHSYSRTHLMSDFDALEVAHRDDSLVLEPGRSFAFVSGLGGHSPRGQARDADWWASTYSLGDGASAGALFCTFSGRSAECRFEDITGAVPDRFTLESRVGAVPTPSDGADASAGADDVDGASTEEEASSAEPEAVSAEERRSVEETPAVEAVAVEEEDVPSTASEATPSGEGTSGERATESGEVAVAAPSAASEPSAAEEAPSTGGEGVVDDAVSVDTTGLMAAPPPARESGATSLDAMADAAEPSSVGPSVADDVGTPAPLEPVAPVPPSARPERSVDPEDVPTVSVETGDVALAPAPADGTGSVVTGGGGGIAGATLVVLLPFGGARRRARAAGTRVHGGERPAPRR